MLSNVVSARLSFLLLLFSGTLCSAMIIPFMGYFLVEGLGYKPWIISVYSVFAVGLTLIVNRQFSRRIDSGDRVFPLVGFAALGYVVAATALSLSPALWTVLTFGVVGFGISSSAVSTMFSLGGSLAERHGMERSRFNAHMRATTSTAWMVGPALTFLIADLIDIQSVFFAALTIATLWIGLWWWTARAHEVSDARFPLDRHARADQIGHVAVNRALRHLQVFGKTPRSDQPPAPKGLNNLEKSICAAPRSGRLEQADGVPIGVIGIGKLARRNGDRIRQNLAASVGYTRHRRLQGVGHQKVNGRPIGRGLAGVKMACAALVTGRQEGHRVRPRVINCQLISKNVTVKRHGARHIGDGNFCPNNGTCGLKRHRVIPF